MLSWAWQSLTLACFILPSSVLVLVSKFCLSLSIISDFDPPHDSSDVGWNWPCKVSGCFLMTHRCSWEKLDWPLEFGFSYKLMIPHFKSQFGDTKWHITQDDTKRSFGQYLFLSKKKPEGLKLCYLLLIVKKDFL